MPSLAAHRFEDTVSLRRHRGGRGGEEKRIQIALHRDSLRQKRPHPGQPQIPIHAEGPSPGAQQRLPTAVNAPAKNDYGHVSFQPGDDNAIYLTGTRRSRADLSRKSQGSTAIRDSG